jgi:hypothetical protein
MPKDGNQAELLEESQSDWCGMRRKTQGLIEVG